MGKATSTASTEVATAAAAVTATTMTTRGAMTAQVETMCNLSRVRRACGDMDSAIRLGEEAVEVARGLVFAAIAAASPLQQQQQQQQQQQSASHPFVRNRLITLGNLYVEGGRISEAMNTFAEVTRAAGALSSSSTAVMAAAILGEDHDSGERAASAAARLGGVCLGYPCAAAA